MKTMKVELNLFTNWKQVSEDEWVPGDGSIEDAIIAAAAQQLLMVEVPVEEPADEAEPKDPDDIFAEPSKPVRYEKREKLRVKLEERIASAVEEKVGAVAMTELEAEVRKVTAEGWNQTDSHGRATGKKTTLSSLVLDWFNANGDSFHSDRRTRIEKMIEKETSAALQKVFAAEIEAARVAFRAQLDGVLQAKLRETLASALGLKA